MLVKEKLRDKSDKSNNNDDDDIEIVTEAPIDDNKIVPASNDSPNYRDSPTRLTQSSDVAWDWHSPVADKKNYSNKESIIGTPRASKLSRKKRNSNSPLLYKPLKRVLIKKESSNGVNSFKAELQALSNQLNSGNSGQSKNESAENVNPFKEEIIDDIDINDFNDDIDLHENKNDINVVENDQNKSNNNKNDYQNKEASVKSYDELLNDSIDDEFMVQCSQEVENKLKFEDKNTINNFESESKKVEKIKNNYVLPLLSNSQNCNNYLKQSSISSSVQQPTTSSNLVTKEKSFQVKKTYGTSKTTALTSNKLSSNVPFIPKSRPSTSSSSSSSLSYQKPINIENLNSFSSSTKNNISKESKINLSKPSTSPVVEIFEILDDDDDLFNDVELSTTVLNTQFNSNSNSNNNNNNNNNQSVKNSNKLTSHQAQKSSVSKIETQQIPTTSGGLGSFQMKFFKSKSTSDSNFDKNYTKVSTSIKTNNNNIINGKKNVGESNKTSKLRSVSNNDLAISNTGFNNLNSGFNNAKTCDSDRLKVKKDGDIIMQCTTEEIEKKRLEAQMRRAAKMKNNNKKI